MTPRATVWACRCAATSETIRMFRVVLEEYRALCQLRKRLEADIVDAAGDAAGLSSGCRPSRASGRFSR